MKAWCHSETSFWWQQWVGVCTLQVAKQQGEYVAKLLASGKAKPGQPISGMKPFR